MRTSWSWRLIIIGAALIALTLAACRGGGASPPTNTELKVIRPTTPASVCRNDSYPADAPQFEGSEELAWQTTPSGVKYYDYVTGTGEQATIDSIVEVHYSGWMMDGCLFDSSRLRDDTVLLRARVCNSGMARRHEHYERWRPPQARNTLATRLR